jgi:alkylation response protein AidB-like acyl-CoA dehydrogenase
MDFSFNQEQLSYKKSVLEFARNELVRDVIPLDRNSDFDRDGFVKCAQFGVQGLPIPEQYGGSAADALTVVAAMEALGYACKDNGLLFSINAQMWSFELPILEFGSEKQKKHYLPRLCSGEMIGVHAMTEAQSGSDAFDLRTEAAKKNGRYVLNGTKMFITNAPVADSILVFATVDRSKGLQGISAFIVDKGTPGFSVSKHVEKMGLRTSPMGEIVLEDCEIPEENRLGPEGAGAAIFNCSMEWERGAILANYLGTMQRQIETCVRYARNRKQFGKPIGKFQAVAHRIANMKLRLETSRWLVYRVGWMKQQGESAVMDSAIAKLCVSENLVQCCQDAIHIHGAYGYMTDSGIERDLRDSISATIYSGTSEIQRNIIAAWLGLPKAE